MRPRPARSAWSACAPDRGIDVLGVLPGHRRRDDVPAVLVEFDPSNAGLARRGADEAGLTRVQVREADAGDVEQLRGCVASRRAAALRHLRQHHRYRDRAGGPGGVGDVRAGRDGDLDQASPGAGPDAADQGMVRGERLRRGRVRCAGHRGRGRRRRESAESSHLGEAAGRPVVYLQDARPASADPDKGAGVEFHIAVPAAEIEAIHAAHRVGADGATELAAQPWGERAFHAVIVGYRFLIAAESTA